MQKMSVKVHFSILITVCYWQVSCIILSLKHCWLMQLVQPCLLRRLIEDELEIQYNRIDKKKFNSTKPKNTHTHTHTYIGIMFYSNKELCFLSLDCKLHFFFFSFLSYLGYKDHFYITLWLKNHVFYPITVKRKIYIYYNKF